MPATTFHDYYETLGVPRDATADQIQSAFRKQARKLHPDVSKEPGAEEKFKQLNEAYEVLRDPEKRRKYDQLGQNWKNGQEFTPPPGWGDARGSGQGAGGGFDFSGGDFSDFFESLFGGRGGAQGRSRGPRRGDDAEAEISISLEDAYHGATRTITLRRAGRGQDGRTDTLELRIPPGTTEGSVLRLAGQGGGGTEGGPAGDLYVRVRLEPHPLFRVDGQNLETDAPVTPWEAALGAEVPVRTLDGTAHTKLPPGTSCGKRLRLRGQGLPDRSGKRGDLFARVRIDVPRTLTERERSLFEELKRASDFNPRKGR